MYKKKDITPLISWISQYQKKTKVEFAVHVKHTNRHHKNT
jgi:hypothetical protein